MNALVSLLFFEKRLNTGLLTNYLSFTPFQYKLGLIKTLIARVYKINNTTQGFHTLTTILKRNMFPRSTLMVVYVILNDPVASFIR